MKAVCARQYGLPEQLEILEVDTPTAGPGEVVVDVTAAGVGFVDGLLIQGRYQIKPDLPYFPGSEFAGRVHSIGEGVTSRSIGDRVMGLGSGTFAQQIRVRADACMTIPADMTNEVAAGFVLNYATALYGLRDCGRLQPRENVLILGASGGVGSATIAVTRAMGARPIAAASTDRKIARALEFGADAGVNYTRADWRKEVQALTHEGGLNVVCDPVGGDIAEAALRSLAPGGRYLVVGFAAGAIPAIPLNLPLLKRCSIVGVDWGGATRADPTLTPGLIATLLEWFAAGLLKPAPVTVRPLDTVRTALGEQLQGQITGKLVLAVADQ